MIQNSAMGSAGKSVGGGAPAPSGPDDYGQRSRPARQEVHAGTAAAAYDDDEPFVHVLDADTVTDLWGVPTAWKQSRAFLARP